MNAQMLLDQFLGAQKGDEESGQARTTTGVLPNRGMTAALGGLAAGGLIGVLIGNKKARKTVGSLAGGVVGYGGAAALGALAHRAYQKWQEGRASAPVASTPVASSSGGQGAAHQANAATGTAARFDPSLAPASDGQPFELAIVKAMISAANADGHICEKERRTILARLSASPLDADDKAFVLDALMSPPTVAQIAALASGPEQAVELYLASRLVIDPDVAVERVHLETLACELSLPEGLAAEIERQVTQDAQLAAA